MTKSNFKKISNDVSSVTSSLLRHRKNVTKLTSHDFSFLGRFQNFWLRHNAS